MTSEQNKVLSEEMDELLYWPNYRMLNIRWPPFSETKKEEKDRVTLRQLWGDWFYSINYYPKNFSVKLGQYGNEVNKKILL
jgi:hypothetical protein